MDIGVNLFYTHAGAYPKLSDDNYWKIHLQINSIGLADYCKKFCSGGSVFCYDGNHSLVYKYIFVDLIPLSLAYNS